MKLSNEAKIGMFVGVAVVLLAVLTIKTGNFNFSKKGYELTIDFETIDGIDLNAPVMLNGLEVGHVKDIIIIEENDDTMMRLTVWLEEKARVRQGAKAYVKNMGFMGEKYVGLTDGDKGAAVLTPGSVIVGQEPADLDKLLSEAQEIASTINERLQKNKVAIDQIIANLDVTMKNANSITTNVDERLRVNQQNIDETLTNLKRASINLDQLTYDLKQHPWKIMYRSKEKRQESIDLLKEEKNRGN